jgi:type IV secretory pathway VirB4 component
MNEALAFLSIMGATAAAAGLCQQLNIVERGSKYLDKLRSRSENFLEGEASTSEYLPEYLPYRDFDPVENAIETSPGYVWQGIRLREIASDGLSAKDWNQLARGFNSLYSGLAPGTRVQIIHTINQSPQQALTVLSEASSRLSPMLSNYSRKAQQRFLRELGSKGELRMHETLVYIGKPLSVPIIEGQLWQRRLKERPFVDVDEQTYVEDLEDLKRRKRTFQQAYETLGGDSEAITANETWKIAWKLLNPNYCLKMTAPALVAQESEPSNQVVSDSRNQEAMYDQYLDGQSSPREDMTGEMFARGPGYIKVQSVAGITYYATISFGRLPVKVRPGQLELLLRHGDINFPVYLSSMFEIADQMRSDEEFERKMSRLQKSLWRASLTEQAKLEEYAEVRGQMLNGQVVGKFGIKVVVSALSLKELKRRQEILMQILRFGEAMPVIDVNTPLEELLAALPCATGSDVYAKPLLSGCAACLSTLTGPPRGVAATEAKTVFLTPTGSPFYWNNRKGDSNNHMYALVGQPGSGKSGLINWLRILELGEGSRGVTIDYGGSSERLCRSVAGNYYNMNNPALQLGVFDIAARKGESYSKEELTADAIPKDGLSLVSHMLEMLSLNANEVALEAQRKKVLTECVIATYQRLDREIPILEDFINTLNMCHGEKREFGREVAARLSVYSQDGNVAQFLNQVCPAPAIDNSYTVFNFSGLQQDPRQMLVASMAILQFLNRFMRTGATVKKFVDIDELHYITSEPRLRKALDLIVRTARKENCIVMLSTQSPADFNHTDLAGIVSSISAYWLLSLPQPELVRQYLGLPPVVVDGLRRLNIGASNARDALLYDNGQIAHLRLKMDPLTARIALGKGKDRATLEEALNYVAITDADRQCLNLALG